MKQPRITSTVRIEQNRTAAAVCWQLRASAGERFGVEHKLPLCYRPEGECLGICRFPCTTGGKSFTSSYTSVMYRSLLCCVSPSVVASYGAVRFAAKTSSKDFP